MDNKFTQEFIRLADNYGYNVAYFSIDEEKGVVNIESTLTNTQENRKDGDTISVYTTDTSGMSE